MIYKLSVLALILAALLANAVAFQSTFNGRIMASRSSVARYTRGVHLEMVKKSVGDLSDAELKGKKVLVRCDLNVPLDGKTITDDTRIRASVPTVKHLMEKGAKVMLSSHLGRPKNGPEDKFSLAPCAARLTELLGKECVMAPDCIGDDVKSLVDKMEEGDVMLLENVRFYPEEEKNDPDFAKKLAANADLYVNDAFGTAHRAHGSTEGVTKFLSPSVSGFLLQKELDYLQGAIADPKKPFAAIVGGSKVSSKIGVIESLLETCDKLVIGGGMVFTFLKARGLNTGSSLVEEDKLELAKELEVKAAEKGVKIILPTDVVVADAFAPDANSKTVKVEEIEDGWMGLDNGAESTKMIQEELSECKTVVWNGPMGVFEFDKFAAGTFAIADTLAEITPGGAITIVGGGDSVAAVEKAGLAEKMSHISTGGGASLELLEGKVLPGVAALDEAEVVVEKPAPVKKGKKGKKAKKVEPVAKVEEKPAVKVVEEKPAKSPTPSKSSVNSAIAIPKLPVFLYEFGVDVPEAEAKESEAIVAELTTALASEESKTKGRIQLAYKDVSKKIVALDVCSDLFEGKSEDERVSMVLAVTDKYSISIDELYVMSFYEKFWAYHDTVNEGCINVEVDPNEPVEDFKKDEYETRLKAISGEMLKTVSGDIKPELERLFK